MGRQVILLIADADRDAIADRAAHVVADISDQCQALVHSLRRKGGEEVAAMGATLDLTLHAAHHRAFQLYATAASELETLIVRLVDGGKPPPLGHAAGFPVIDGSNPEAASPSEKSS